MGEIGHHRQPVETGVLMDTWKHIEELSTGRRLWMVMNAKRNNKLVMLQRCNAYKVCETIFVLLIVAKCVECTNITHKIQCTRAPSANLVVCCVPLSMCKFLVVH